MAHTGEHNICISAMVKMIEMYEKHSALFIFKTIIIISSNVTAQPQQLIERE